MGSTANAIRGRRTSATAVQALVPIGGSAGAATGKIDKPIHPLAKVCAIGSGLLRYATSCVGMFPVARHSYHPACTYHPPPWSADAGQTTICETYVT